MIREEARTMFDVAEKEKTCTRINERFVYGYYLTIYDLQKLVRDFQADCFDGFVSNDQSYIEEWLKKHEQIVKIFD